MSSSLQISKTRLVFELHPRTFPGRRLNGLCVPPRDAHKGGRASPTSNGEHITWDPDGLFSSSTATGGHFARRERERGASSSSSSTVENPVPTDHPPLQPLPCHPSPLGVAASDKNAYDRISLYQQLKTRYMPVDLDYPGLRVLHLDPPVFLVEKFWTAETCQALVNAAMATGRMTASKIGDVNVTSSAAESSSRRTSSTLMIDGATRSEFPGLDSCATTLQTAGRALLGGLQSDIDEDQGSRSSWGIPEKLPAPGQYCYEGLQATEYLDGQLFMEHQDAFPLDSARKNRFQRHGTLLVYLNTVSSGGETSFHHLGLSVSPVQGNALLFFPAFADGAPDERTLHSADAVLGGATKYVCQQWIARGFRRSAAPLVKSSRGEEEEIAHVEEFIMGRKGKRKGGKQKSGRDSGPADALVGKKKGFGA